MPICINRILRLWDFVKSLRFCILHYQHGNLHTSELHQNLNNDNAQMKNSLSYASGMIIANSRVFVFNNIFLKKMSSIWTQQAINSHVLIIIDCSHPLIQFPICLNIQGSYDFEEDSSHIFIKSDGQNKSLNYLLLALFCGIGSI